MSAIEVKRLALPGRFAVGGVDGLYLRISERGARSWVFRTSIGSRRSDLGLGPYPDVSLAMARERARDVKELIFQGIDPVAQRREQKAALREARSSLITFDEASSRFIASKSHEFRNAKHKTQWENTLKTYASPVVGNMQVSEVELSHVVRILDPIWTTKTETASRLRGRIEAVLAWATVSGYRSGENPARWKGHLDAVLAKPSKVKNVVHHKALPFSQIGTFVNELRQREALAARCLEFLILTACRSGEARGAVWSEIDAKEKVWTIPGERMKAGREHRVPLTDRVLEILKELPRLGDSDLVFPGPQGGMMSENTLGAVIKRMKYRCTAHGFRSTFRDWCAEMTSYPHEIAEMALAHTIKNKAEAAYRRGDLLAKRARLMAAWETYCYTLPKNADKVVGIRKLEQEA